MLLNIIRQDRYSRGELLLRSFFGALYIALPHGIMLVFLAIGAIFLRIVTFIMILANGIYPESHWRYYERFFRWNLRVNARLNNLVDGYPAFGLDGSDDKTQLEIPYVAEASRGNAALVFFLGFLLLIPHLFLLYFKAIGAAFIMFIAWWAVLFTGHYPEGMHGYMTRFMRYAMRINTWIYFMRQSYPPFNGQPDAGQLIETEMSFGAERAA